MIRCSLILPITLAAVLAAIAGHAQSIDAYNPNPSGPVNTMAPQADGKLIIGGNFYAIAGGPQSRIARLNVDGSLDTSFANIGVNSNITAVAVQPDGKVLIGGDFDQVGGQARHHLARLNADGTLDSAFADPGLDGGVVAIAVQRDGSVVVGGSFTKVGSVAKNYLARLDAQGGFDQNSFANPQLCCGPVRSVALQADGNVLVGGYFSQVGTASQFYFARFSASGAFDATFPNIGRDIQAGSIVVAPDGSVYVADVGAEYVVKLTAGGTAAPGFTSAVADSTINAIALQPNGKVVISGIFQTVGGQARHGMARLNADGSLDATFADPQLSLDSTHPNGYVYGVGAQSDGNIVAVGNFSLASGQPRNLMARITTGDYVKNALTVQPGSGNLIATWTRAGDGPELVQAPNLGHSTDGVNFTIVGPMTRIANGWQVTAPYNVHGSLFYLRASGTTSNGAGNGSPGQIASDVFFSDTIFKSGFE